MKNKSKLSRSIFLMIIIVLLVVMGILILYFNSNKYSNCANAGERSISNFDMTTGKSDPNIEILECCSGLVNIADKQPLTNTNSDGSITGTTPWAWNAPASAVTLALGSTGFPGLLPGTSAFTFMTDDKGEGSWHYNFMDVIGAFSVWINGGGRTILISDPIVR